ncbi:MAG: hypothetical protein AAF065_14480, partial [Verrucomicrobiota bacterium]
SERAFGSGTAGTYLSGNDQKVSSPHISVGCQKRDQSLGENGQLTLHFAQPVKMLPPLVSAITSRPHLERKALLRC